MDLSDEEDMFALSEEDLPQPVLKVNPVEENLITELNSVQKRIDRTNSDIEEFQLLIKKGLKQFAHVAKYGEELDLDFGGEWFTISGEPIIHHGSQKVLKCKQPLTIRNLFHYIIDDKWIILVTLRNTSNWHLEDLRFYICLKNDNELNGTSTFWILVDDSFWNTTESIKPNTDLIIGTVILDVPTFEKESSVEACGTILYKAEEKSYQTTVPNFDLSVEKTIDGTCIVDFTNYPQVCILAMKAVSVEKILSIDIQLPAVSDRFFDFLEKYSFQEVIDDIRVVRNFGCLKYCILEILSITEFEVKIKVSAGSIAQLSIVLTLLRQEFSDIPDLAEEENCLEAATTLLQELELLLSNESPADIQRAKINSDMIIP